MPRPPVRALALLAAALLLLLLAPPLARPAAAGLDCATFDASQIKLVTFDVFAALMDLITSMRATIAAIVPELSAERVDQLMEVWIDSYGSVAGDAFTPSQTGGAEPFVWVERNGLVDAVQKLGLQSLIPIGGKRFDALLERAWSELQPWAGTADALALISTRFAVAPLSNGDNRTLALAISIFAPRVRFARIFSSDFPVGAFKPNPAMYAQVAAAVPAENNVLHVAGAPIDGLGARQYGIYSALLHNPPLPGIQPCFVLANITLLPPILGF